MLRRNTIGMTALTIIPPFCAQARNYAKYPYENRRIRD
jgi:hypothetical protein